MLQAKKKVHSRNGGHIRKREVVRDTVEELETPRIRRVVSPGASTRDRDQTGFAEHFQVMGDRRLCHIELTDYITDAQRLRLGRDEAEDVQTRRIAQRSE